MYQLILFLHVMICMMVIGLVLIQHGKGADIGASFGSGASNTVFGSQGAVGFLFKCTAILACIFFLTSLMLSYYVSIQHQRANQMVVPVVDESKVNDKILPAKPEQKK